MDRAESSGGTDEEGPRGEANRHREGADRGEKGNGCEFGLLAPDIKDKQGTAGTKREKKTRQTESFRQRGGTNSLTAGICPT